MCCPSSAAPSKLTPPPLWRSLHWQAACLLSWAWGPAHPHRDLRLLESCFVLFGYKVHVQGEWSPWRWVISSPCKGGNCCLFLSLATTPEGTQHLQITQKNSAQEWMEWGPQVRRRRGAFPTHSQWGFNETQIWVDSKRHRVHVIYLLFPYH